MGSTPGSGPLLVDGAPAGGGGIGDQSNQVRYRPPGSAPDTRPGGLPRGTSGQVYSPDAAGGLAWSPVTPLSGRISMRQPVSRAASLAFCPSLPMASDSW